MDSGPKKKSYKKAKKDSDADLNDSPRSDRVGRIC